MIMEKTMDYFIHTAFVDYNGYLKPAGILDLFQDVAAIHADEIGVGKKDMDSLGLIWAVLYTRIDIEGELPRFSDVVKVGTWPKIPGKLEFNREYELISNGNRVAKGISTWFVLDSKNHKIVKPNMVKFIGEHKPEVLYDTPSKRKLGLTGSQFTDTYSYTVRYSDMDVNGHMNNARYLDLVFEMQKNIDKKIKSLEIGFVHEAKPGDLIRVGYYTDDTFDYYMGYVGDVLSFEVKIEVK